MDVLVSVPSRIKHMTKIIVVDSSAYWVSKTILR